MTLLRACAGLLLVLLASGCSREVGAGEEGGRIPLDVQQLAAANLWSPPAPDTAPRYGSLSAASAAAEVAIENHAHSLSTVLYSEHDAEVAARMEGVVSSFSVDLGDRVSAGQVLAVLQDESERAAVASAEATLELARLEHSRARQLNEQQMLSDSDLDQAAYRVRLAEAALRETHVRLGYTRIRAPFAGVVSRRFIRIGQTVERGEPLYRITALTPLRAQVRVPELAARSLAVGQQLHLRSPGGEVVVGSVARISPAVDPASGTIEVLVSIPDPSGLRPGSAVFVEFASDRGLEP